MTKDELKKTKLADIAHLRDYNHDSLDEDDYDMIWACIDNLTCTNDRRGKALAEIADKTAPAVNPCRYGDSVSAKEIFDIAQAALGEGPVPTSVGRTELAKALDEAWESAEVDLSKPAPRTQDELDESNAEFDLQMAKYILSRYKIERR